MDEERTIASTEYMAARAERVSTLAAGPLPDDAQQRCELCRAEARAGLDQIRQALADLTRSLELEQKETRYLAWQNEELKRQIAALKGEAKE